MNLFRRFVFLGLVALPLSLCALSCSSSADGTVPATLCGTRIDPALTRLLLPSSEDLHEFTRVDREEAITAPCVLLAGREPALEFQFSWDEGATNLMYLATGSGSVSHVNEPRNADFAMKAVVGTDGAIATTRCKTKGGNYFTLTLQLPRIKTGDHSHREDIETFMRAYFPATVKTLGCS
ncbi:hypothetical protein ABZ079_20065 [Streptomyces sp. NPDC006314]|uniref:hypothetical protein n=1 Tax=Streptomyces sp. NPDC006314 TaxID=3154475 RepID=UPI0033A0B737